MSKKLGTCPPPANTQMMKELIEFDGEIAFADLCVLYTCNEIKFDFLFYQTSSFWIFWNKVIIFKFQKTNEFELKCHSSNTEKYEWLHT